MSLKIVSLAPSNTDVIREIGNGDNLEAVSTLNKNIGLKKAGGWVSGPRFDVIKEIDPDYIFTSDKLQRKVKVALEDKGYKVKHYEPENLQQVYKSIIEIGEVLNSRKEAEELVRKMKKTFDDIDLNGARIYCEEWSDPPMISGNWIPDMIREIEGKYPIESGRSKEIEMKNIRRFNPEYIFLNTCGNQRVNKEQISSREKLETVSAVKKNNLYQINDSLLNRPSHKLIRGAKEIENKVLE